MKKNRIKFFPDYLEHYLQHHQDTRNQWFHTVALFISIFCFVLFLLTWQLIWLVMTPIFGHGIAWLGHKFFEENRPLVWQQPIYAFFAEVILVVRLLKRSCFRFGTNR